MARESDERRGRPRGDKRARTRAKLLQAAREVTREKGYERTTMEEVARRAGMTTGAIYGNFRNKDELFIALSETYWPPVKPSIAPGADLSAVLQAFAEATLDSLPERRGAAVGFFSGKAYAMGHEAVRERARDITAKSYEEGAQWLRHAVGDEALPFSADIMVRVIHALTEGLMLQRLMTPELIGDEVFHAAFAMLASASDAAEPAE